MRCPKCGVDRPSSAVECTRCGVVFAKMQREDVSQPEERPAAPPSEAVAAWDALLPPAPGEAARQPLPEAPTVGRPTRPATTGAHRAQAAEPLSPVRSQEGHYVAPDSAASPMQATPPKPAAPTKSGTATNVRLVRAARNSPPLPEVFDEAAFAAIRQKVAPQEDDVVRDGRIGPDEWKVLGMGLVAAVVVYAIPITRLLVSALVTLFHELGHAVVGWALAIPSIPAFDFVYGGGFTHQAGFQPILAVVIAGAFAWGIWRFRTNRTTAIVIGVLFLFWLLVVSSEWRRELVIACAGHAAEFVMAGIFFYKALSGTGWKQPEIERPLGAFVAFFVQFHSMGFAWRLMHDPDFLDWYREGKGGALMNDLEVVSLDLRIWTKIPMSIEGVAGLLFVFSFVPIAVALVWYFQRARWHRTLRALGTVSA